MAEAEVASDGPETLILRFRDLVTAPGDTILRHVEELGEGAGHVWWGWWAKSGEQVPAEVFGRLLRRARAEGLPIFLFDSGRLLLFRAVCTDIEWDHAGDLQPTPEPARTPAYYGEQKYRAWFKFSEIAAEPVQPPEEVLHRYSYVQVDSFFSGAASKFTPFYGKQVSSLAELKSQDRTVWFLRPVRATDPTHEVVTVKGRGGLNPSHFPRDFAQSPSLNLLWMSDVHFGQHAFPDAPNASGQPLAVRVETACRDHGVKDLAGMILSGDLTWRGGRDGFAQARSLVQQTTSWAGLDNYQVAVCPGNHDIDFAKVPAAEWTPAVPAPEPASEAYAEFYEKLFYLHPNQYLSCGRRFLLRGAVPVELVCLNSSLLHQNAKLFQGHGFVGDQQLADAEQQMGWDRRTDDPLPVRIVVVHHHLLQVTYRAEPVVGTPYSVALDAEALTRWAMRHRVRVVLHGHMHNPYHATIERPLSFGRTDRRHRLHVFGLGSTGVLAKHLDPEHPRNMFAVLRFGAGELAVRYYSVHQDLPSEELASYTVPLTE